MNNDELLKMALRHLTPQQIAEAIASAKRDKTQHATQDSDKDKDTLSHSQSYTDVLEQQLDADTLNPDTFADLSFDRQMLRQLLDEFAKTQPIDNQPTTNSFAFLHKWWDGTQFVIKNDWLFSDLKQIEVELINKAGESKFFRLKVSL